MTADFQKAVAPLLLAEGGYSDSASDAGGITRYGISEKSYPHLDISSLTVSDAAAILKCDFWDFYGMGNLNDQNLANHVFLLFINTDPKDAAKVVQNALCSYGTPVKIDGNFGPATRQAINSASSPPALLAYLRLEECRFYLGLADHFPAQRPNFRGWIRRAVID